VPIVGAPRPVLRERAARHQSALKRGSYVLSLALLACAVGGCAHSLVYDENRDRQAKEAKNAAEELKLAGALTSLEKSVSELAALEEARARDRAQLLFELELQTVVRAPSLDSKLEPDGAGGSSGLLTVIRERMTELGVDSADAPGESKTLKAIRTLPVRLDQRRKRLNLDLDEFQGTVGYKFENCAQIVAASSNPALKTPEPAEQFLARIGAARRGLAREKYPALIESCKKVEEVLFAPSNMPLKEGEILKLAKHQKAVAEEVQAFETDMAKAREQLAKAVAEFEAGNDTKKPSGQSTKSESLEERAQKLEKAVRQLAKGTSKLGQAGAAAAATEQLKRLESVLAAVAGSSNEGKVQLSADDQASVAMVRSFPALADEADDLLAEAKRPRLVPLLMAIDHQKLVVQGYDAELAIMNRRVETVTRQLDSAMNELVALAGIADRLTRKPGWAAQSIPKLRRSLTPEEKFVLFEALAIYADDVPRYRTDRAVWRARELALEHERGLVASKYAAAQWDSMITAVASVLSDYHASGMKQADIAEFLKALGLVVIGIGVAQ
jgi:hypothetical protein